MTVSHWAKTTHHEVTYVRRGDVSELLTVARDFADDEGSMWTVEDDAIVFSRPMGTTLVGREPE